MSLADHWTASGSDSCSDDDLWFQHHPVHSLGDVDIGSIMRSHEESYETLLILILELSTMEWNLNSLRLVR
jgi:hypothetical protein